MQWGFSPRPEWFDHYLDQHWQWSARNNSLWVERGVFSRMVIKPNARMLEICCGDGFNTRHFYSSRASSITAVDFDKDAIPHARRYNSAPNITYVQQDIRDGLPAGSFDNIVWDAAIEHFTETEIADVMANIKKRLTPTGILSGFTIVERSDGKKMLPHHEYEFKSKDDLARFFRPHFHNVKVFETIYADRHNLYFWASDGIIPFMPDGWDAAAGFCDTEGNERGRHGAHEIGEGSRGAEAAGDVRGKNENRRADGDVEDGGGESAHTDDAPQGGVGVGHTAAAINSENFGRSILPPDTMATTGPGPALPVSAAARPSAPAPSAMTRAFSAMRRMALFTWSRVTTM